MRGSVIKRKGRWYVVTRHRQHDGTYKQRYHGGHATKREADKALNEIINRLNHGFDVRPNKITLADYIDSHWLPQIEHAVRPSTLDSYQRNLRLHVLPTLGGELLQSLTPAHLNALYADLLASGRKDGPGGLSAKTVRYIHTTIHKALADAVDSELVLTNVAERAKAPKASAAKAKTLDTWTTDQLARFYEHVASDRLHALWRVAGQTGMRRGELLGLRWKDIDLDAARISVRQTILSVNYDIVEGDAKTQRGTRTIDLDATTVAIVRRHRAHQAQERLAWGSAYRDRDLVFARENGEILHPDLISKQFGTRSEAAGLPRIRLHDLRHTHATHLLLAGTPVKVVSERLGHSDVAFTMNTYAHVMPGMQAEAAAAVAALVDG